MNRTVNKRDLNNTTRVVWKIKKDKAEQAEYALGVVSGIIKAVFKPITWKKATIKNLPERTLNSPDQIGFDGIEAEPAVKKLYVGKRVPEDYRKPGAAFPVKYVNIK